MIVINDELSPQKPGESNIPSEMDTTMYEIQAEDKLLTETKKDNLRKEISDIEAGIKTAGQAIRSAEEMKYSYLQASPESASKLHKDLIFMKRDLEKKKVEYEKLN